MHVTLTCIFLDVKIRINVSGQDKRNKERTMAIIMVDYENRGIEALRGIHHLNSEDALYIFYSDCCRKIHAENMKSIVDAGCDFHICKLKNTGKNALDFYIATELGAIFGGGYEGEIAIISNDKGYRAVIDFWKQNGDKKRNVVLAPDIQTGLLLMNMPQDQDRRIWLQNCMKPLDLGEEYAKYKQRKDFRNKLETVFLQTKYEGMIEQIMVLMEET